LTGGPFGVAFIPRPFGSLAEHSVLFNFVNLGVVASVTLAVYLALEHLARSPWGRVLTALREDERAAISLGKSARSYRVQAFAVGGAVMGLAGAVQAHFIGFIAPDNYLPTLTFQVWAMLMVGGSGSNRGALAGTIVVWAIWVGSSAIASAIVPTDWQARTAALQIVAIGSLLCLILVLRPQGFFGARHRGNAG
jgi:branched-chain amino acid transport system permease protein